MEWLIISRWLEALQAHAEPIQRGTLLLLGVALLLFGRTVLRLGVLAFLLALGTIAALFLLLKCPLFSWLPREPVAAWGFVILIGCLVASTTRFEIVSRWVEVAGTLVLCAFLFPVLVRLHGTLPAWLLVLVIVLAAGISRAALVGALASVVFLAALGVSSTASAGLVIGLCLLTSWIRHGRLPAESIALRRRDAHLGALQILRASASDTVRVIASFERSRDLQRFRQLAHRRGHHTRTFEPLSGFLEIDLPRFEAMALQRLPSLMGLFRAVPSLLVEAASRVKLDRPRLHETSTNTISLEEIEKRQRRLPGGARLSEPSTFGKGVTACVIDTGCEERPEYMENVVERRSFVTSEPDPDDESDCRHGSNVLMIVHQMAPEARLISLKAMSREGYGELSWIFEALAFAVRKKVDVINASFGGCACKGMNACIMCRAINNIPVVVSASAGNSGRDGLSCPGAARGAIATAACDSEGRIAPFSGRGPSLDPSNPKPDVTAYGSGVMLRTRLNGPNDVPMDGTSFSAPITTGVVACLHSAARANGIAFEKTKVRKILREAARPEEIARGHRDPLAAGAGMVSLADAVVAVLGVKRNAMLPRTAHLFFRPLPIAAGALFALVIAWTFLFDHGCHLLLQECDGSTRLLGRVRKLQNGELAIDDGTALLRLQWATESSRPAPGDIIWLSADWLAAEHRLLGKARVVLW